jgi:hypothetical protein
VLQSSSELGWSNLFAEVRSYGRGKWAHPDPTETSNLIVRPRLVGVPFVIADRPQSARLWLLHRAIEGRA